MGPGTLSGCGIGSEPRLPCAGPDASFAANRRTDDARCRRCHDRPLRYRRFPQGDRRCPGHDRPAAGEAALARLLLVLAGPQQAAPRQVGRRGGDAAQRGRRDRRRGGVREAAYSAHPARRRDRQLRTGGAARRRRAARSHQHDEDRVAKARRDPLRARPEDERPRRRHPAERFRAAHASLHQADGDDRRFRRRRLGRHRLGELWRPARAGKHLWRRAW